MSFNTVPWAWGVDGITPTQKLVLMGLASYADEKDSCYPGQETLADRAGVSTRTVRRALDDLEKLGLIERSRRMDSRGYRTSDRYFLKVGAKVQPDNMSAGSGDLTGQMEQTLPDIDDRLTGHPCPSNYPENSKGELPVTPIVPKPSFDDFYAAYPVKKSKDAARRAWAKAIKREDPHVILAGLQRFVNDPNLPEKQFLKYPATWLNSGCWDDEPFPERQQSGARVDENLAEYQRLYGGGQVAGARSVSAIGPGIS